MQPLRLLRSDNLQDLSPEAVETLVTRFGVTDVVDLRTHVELAKEGDGPLRAPGPSATTTTRSTARTRSSQESPQPSARCPGRRTSAVRRAAAARAAARRPEEDRRRSHEQFWSEHYLSYLATRPDSVVAALGDIASSRGAAIVHCAAGKDRTGTVVGLALKVAGVPDDLVIADFAASAERVPAIMARLRSSTAYAANLQDKTIAQQSPTTDTMRLLLAALDERHGGVLGWLGGQGWSAATPTVCAASCSPD